MPDAVKSNFMCHCRQTACGGQNTCGSQVTFMHFHGNLPALVLQCKQWAKLKVLQLRHKSQAFVHSSNRKSYNSIDK